MEASRAAAAAALAAAITGSTAVVAAAVVEVGMAAAVVAVLGTVEGMVVVAMQGATVGATVVHLEATEEGQATPMEEEGHMAVVRRTVVTTVATEQTSTSLPGIKMQRMIAAHFGKKLPGLTAARLGRSLCSSVKCLDAATRWVHS